jgi:hypothetical protein
VASVVNKVKMEDVRGIDVMGHVGELKKVANNFVKTK